MENRYASSVPVRCAMALARILVFPAFFFVFFFSFFYFLFLCTYIVATLPLLQSCSDILPSDHFLVCLECMSLVHRRSCAIGLLVSLPAIACHRDCLCLPAAACVACQGRANATSRNGISLIRGEGQSIRAGTGTGK